MKKKMLSVNDIISCIGDELISISGSYASASIDNLADAQHVNENTLDWVSPSKENKQEIASSSVAKVLLVDETIAPIDGKILLYVKNPKRALAKVGNTFFVEKYEAFIHPTAEISSKAHIGQNVYIGPYSVIGNATIGDGCVIESNVRIYDNVKIGERCRIKPGAVLGGEGFGFVRDENGNKFRFPQIGNLILGNEVEVGANTCIDRGALSDTIIGDYTKINNLCHIAHNNVIGRNVIIAGCVNISGSNTIDDDVWIAPHSCIRGFIHLGENCLIGMGAIVTKDVPEGETWYGNPAKKSGKNNN